MPGRILRPSSAGIPLTGEARQIHHVARSCHKRFVESFDIEYVTFNQGKIVTMALSAGVTTPRLPRGRRGFPVGMLAGSTDTSRS